MRTYVTFSGVEGAIQGLRRFGFVSRKALDDGTRDATQVAFDRSQIYVPVDLGPLKASGKIVRRRTSPGQPIGFSIEYGGAEAPYAVPVHEIRGAYHAPPTCYKYLEKAVRETKAEQSWAMRRRMRAVTTTRVWK